MKTTTLFHPRYALITASALLLAGCGATSAHNAPAGSPGPALASSSPHDVPASTTATPCGRVPTVPGAQADVLIRAGAVNCPQATRVITQYFQKLSPSEAASPNGAGPMALGEWTCGSATGDPVTTCSTEDDRQVEAVIAG
jgi:hypothetical protein